MDGMTVSEYFSDSVLMMSGSINSLRNEKTVVGLKCQRLAGTISICELERSFHTGLITCQSLMSRFQIVKCTYIDRTL